MTNLDPEQVQRYGQMKAEARLRRQMRRQGYPPLPPWSSASGGGRTTRGQWIAIVIMVVVAIVLLLVLIPAMNKSGHSSHYGSISSLK